MIYILPKSYDRILLLLATTVLVWFGVYMQTPAVVVDNDIAMHQQPTVTEPEGTVAPLASKPDYRLDDVLTESTESIPVITHIPTSQKVVFLTIDDGLVRDPQAIALLRQYNIQTPMFLNDEYVRADPDYFRNLAAQGMVVADHTVNHPDLTKLNYDQQVTEICDNASTLTELLGVRPTLFRPPFGSYDANTIAAAQHCGMRALVMWSAKANGGSIQYQDDRDALQSGDIVLMHFRPEFVQDFRAFMDAAAQAGLRPANLNDWLQP